MPFYIEHFTLFTVFIVFTVFTVFTVCDGVNWE